jgi:hypothetical protein
MAEWKYSINVKQHLSNGTSNDAIVKAAKGVLSELKRLPEHLLSDIEDITYEFEEMVRCTHDPEDNDNLLWEFNYQLNSLYDWADYKRVWMGMK